MHFLVCFNNNKTKYIESHARLVYFTIVITWKYARSMCEVTWGRLLKAIANLHAKQNTFALGLRGFQRVLRRRRSCTVAKGKWSTEDVMTMDTIYTRSNLGVHCKSLFNIINSATVQTELSQSGKHRETPSCTQL